MLAGWQAGGRARWLAGILPRLQRSLGTSATPPSRAPRPFAHPTPRHPPTHPPEKVEVWWEGLWW